MEDDKICELAEGGSICCVARTTTCAHANVVLCCLKRDLEIKHPYRKILDLIHKKACSKVERLLDCVKMSNMVMEAVYMLVELIAKCQVQMPQMNY